MRRKRAMSLIVIIGCLMLSLPQRGYGQETAAEDEFKVPKDLSFILELLSPVSTATNQKDDSFSCKVIGPDQYAGATVSGYIKKLKRSGKANGKSEIELAFDSITMTDGRTGGFNAQVVEVYEVDAAGSQGRADAEGTVKAKSRVKVSVKRAVVGAIIGGIIGGAIAGGGGAAAGAAIGASVGITSVLATDGPDLEFKQGTKFKVLTNVAGKREKREQTASSAPVLTPQPTPEPTPAPPAPVAAGAAVSTHDPNAMAKSTQPVRTTAVSAPPQAPQPQAPPAAAPKPAPPPQPVPQPQPVAAQPLPPPAPMRAVTPREPSPRVRAYAGNPLFRLNVPMNWRESSTNNPVTFAPEGGYFPYQGALVLTHGARIGTSASPSQDLRQASEQFINSITQANSYLSRQGDFQNVQLSSRQSLTLVLSGKSSVTGRVEVVTVYTTLLRNNELFYLITVAPQEETAYQAAFQNLLRSIQISD